MPRHVVLSPRAERHLASIYRYVAEISGGVRADQVIDRLVTACRNLDLFAERGVTRDDLFPGLRVMGYRRQATIAFTLDSETVTIQGVFWRGRDVEAEFEE